MPINHWKEKNKSSKKLFSHNLRNQYSNSNTKKCLYFMFDGVSPKITSIKK